MTLALGKSEILFHVLKEINKIKQQEHYTEKRKQCATPRKCFQKVCYMFIIVSTLASQSRNFSIPMLKNLKSKVNYF